MTDASTYEDYKAALDQLERLTQHTPECPLNSGDWPDADGKYAPDDDHDNASFVLRSLLCCLQHDPSATFRHEVIHREDGDITYPVLGSQLSYFEAWEAGDSFTPEEQAQIEPLRLLLHTIISYDFARDKITELATSYSLCPLHFCDWAICFDDEDDECRQIRTIYPHSHDT